MIVIIFLVRIQVDRVEAPPLPSLPLPAPPPSCPPGGDFLLPIIFCTISTSYYYSPDQVTRVDVRDIVVPEKKFSIC